MILIEGLLNYSVPWQLPDIYLFTGNPVVKRDGSIVMGRGAAKQVRDSIPGVDLLFGMGIIENPTANLLWTSTSGVPETRLGWFKVKTHWKDPAEMSIIEESVEQLAAVATARPHFTFHMNYPGVGNGRLGVQDVQPLLEKLPNNVLIYKSEEA